MLIIEGKSLKFVLPYAWNVQVR